MEVILQRLTTADVETEGAVVRLRLGATLVELLQPLAAVINTLVATRAGHATIGEQGTSPWLFPSGQPGDRSARLRWASDSEDSGYDPTRPARPHYSPWPTHSQPRCCPACSASHRRRRRLAR